MSLSIYKKHTHSLGCMSEREEAGIRERDYCCREIIFMFSCFTFGDNSISKEVAGFLPLRFPLEIFFMSLVSFVYCCACYSFS